MLAYIYIYYISYQLWKNKKCSIAPTSRNILPNRALFSAGPLVGSASFPRTGLSRQGTMIPRIPRITIHRTSGHPCEVIIYPDLAVKMGNTGYTSPKSTVFIGKVWKRYT
jgi:hypothetical protein